MQVKRVSNKSFQGRANLPSEKCFAQMIRNMDENDRVGAELKLAMDKQDKTVLYRIKNFFNHVDKSKGYVRTVSFPIDILKITWLKAMDNMRMLVTEKLPEEYTLSGYKNKSLGQSFLSFSLKKGVEYIYGISANIKDPAFAEDGITKAIGLITNPKSKKRFDDLKEIYTDLTESTYIFKNEKFMSPETDRQLKKFQQLKKLAKKKKLQISIQGRKSEYKDSANQFFGEIKDKDNKSLYSSDAFYSSFDYLAQKLEEKLRKI